MPPRLSQQLKNLRGTARPSRTIAPGAHARLDKAPSPPASLSDAAQVEWRALAGILVSGGMLTKGDLRALQLLAETLASVASFAAIVEREGTTVAAGAGGVKAHPALGALATTRAQAVSLLAHFGLTPKSREGVAAAPTPTPGNPFEEFC